MKYIKSKNSKMGMYLDWTKVSDLVAVGSVGVESISLQEYENILKKEKRNKTIKKILSND